ncbi:MAG: patatin-like phospholipase family protein, partial [Burkholderiaceae bacterium]
MTRQPSATSKTGLILMGGGARAAYQVGVLDALHSIRLANGCPADTNPFQVICGTSAGAINAAALAAASDRYGEAIQQILSVWSGFDPSQVYRTDAAGALRNAAHWVATLGLGWMIKSQPRSLFDNSPLTDLLQQMIDFARLERAFENGSVDALAITVSSYTSGQHVTYYQSRAEIAPWFRTQRLSVRSRITLEHLLASSAIPFVFPAVRLKLNGRDEYFGDGTIRQTAPISPAIHLGAQRVLVIGVGQVQTGRVNADHTGSQFTYPSLAQISGHALSSIFLDALANDVERLNRVNHTLELIPEPARRESGLRPVDVLVISPSQRLDQIAIRHAKRVPLTVRTMLAALGATDSRGAGLMSYLLFESGYTRDLIALGRKDTLARRDEVIAFF